MNDWLLPLGIGALAFLIYRLSASAARETAAHERRIEELEAELRLLEAQRAAMHPDHRAALEGRINAAQDELFELIWRNLP